MLGLQEDWGCTIKEVRLVPGDTLVLYTDGLTEAMSHEGEEFGEDRLIELVLRHSGLRVSALLQSILNDVRHFVGKESRDDITIVAASCAGLE